MSAFCKYVRVEPCEVQIEVRTGLARVAAAREAERPAAEYRFCSAALMSEALAAQLRLTLALFPACGDERGPATYGWRHNSESCSSQRECRWTTHSALTHQVMDVPGRRPKPVFKEYRDDETEPDGR